MHTLLIIAAIVASPYFSACRAAENPSGVLAKMPEPPTVKESLTVQIECTAGTAGVDPLPALVSDFTDADAKLTLATSGYTAAQERRKASFDALQTELKRRGFVVDPTPTPTPIVPTPVGPVTSIVVVTSPQSCPPCAQLAPVLTVLQSTIPIQTIDAGSPGAAQWKPTAIPTIVMLVNGKEASRSVGFLDAAAISDWYQKTAAWAVVKFPPPKVSDEVPQPPRR